MAYGRIQGGVDFRSHWIPSGYAVLAYVTGKWEIVKSSNNGANPPTVLASGLGAPLALKQWHSLILSFKGNTIMASLDNKELSGVVDNTFSQGMAGIGCGYHLSLIHI
eukprot:TRINITY_DN7543_c0_g1_i1.p1 TRINITY_DN7543_c0_g1~~TRINITY_DN7543_c0_g1_i1.p1  ORF type:complete len:108 (+),score=16.73 TRINITY_DN7543_c0_g1_i1:69-392(+)